MELLGSKGPPSPPNLSITPQAFGRLRRFRSRMAISRRCPVIRAGRARTSFRTTVQHFSASG